MDLVIAEKPSVGKSIAAVIGAAENHGNYMEGSGHIVSWCLGHLVESCMPDDYDERYGKWSGADLPIIPEQWKYAVKKDSGAKKQFEELKKLMQRDDVTNLVEATDAGREGEYIFRLVYDKAGCSKPFRRLWISSMEDSAIKKGFEELRDGKEYDSLYESAKCRDIADWLVGINCTRLFSGFYNKLLRVGRVQTPTLAMVVGRDRQIRDFVKKPFYRAHIYVNDRGSSFDAVSEAIEEKAAAVKLASECEGMTAAVVSAAKEIKQESAPHLFDLTSLQREANRLFGFSAKQTLDFTQSLYEKKLCTYPRTDSQYLTDDMDDTAKRVIEAVIKTEKIENAVNFTPDTKCLLNSKKVSDHHAVIPTVEILKADLSLLPDGERRILALAGMRLLAAAAPKYVYENTKAVLSCSGSEFTASGRKEIEKGYRKITEAFMGCYKADRQETEDEGQNGNIFKNIEEGMSFENVKSGVSDHMTQPPKHYTEDTLLSAMERAGAAETSDDVERKGLGTPATRADCIEKLIHDGLVIRNKKQLTVSDIGEKLIEVVPEKVRSPIMTAEWENELLEVAAGREKSRVFTDRIKDFVKDIIKNTQINEEARLLFGNSEKKTVGKCPHCGADVIYGKFGAYCGKRCGMMLGRYYQTVFSENQIKDLIEGKKILLKGQKSKAGKSYDMYLTADGIEEAEYTRKDGTAVSGYQFRYIKELKHGSK